MKALSPSSVLIIDDHPLFRKGVSQLLALNNELHLIVSGNSPAFFPTPCPTQTLASQFNTGGETHGRGTQGQVAAA